MHSLPNRILAAVVFCSVIVLILIRPAVVNADHRLQGTVMAADRITRLPNASVSLHEPSGRLVASTKTDSEGKYVLSHVPAAKYIALIREAGSLESARVGSKRRPDSVASRGPLITVTSLDLTDSNAGEQQNFSLSYGGVITGTVKEDDGSTPIPNGTVTAYLPDGTWVAQTNTWQDGVYFLVVPADEYVLDAQGPADLSYRPATYDSLPGDISYSRNLCNATHVIVPPSETVTGKDFQLPQGYGITVTYPNSSGVTWTAGESVTVTWAAVGIQANLPVYMLIRNGPDGPGSFSLAGTVGDGQVTFDVPTWLGDGSGYIVELWAMHQGNFRILSSDQSDAPFAITGSGTVRGLELTAPGATTKWLAGNGHDITWTHANLTGQNVAFVVLDGPTILMQSQGTLASDGTFSLDIPGNIGNGTDYTILAMGSNPQSSAGAFDISPSFEIFGSDPRPTFAITAPNGCETWTAGSPENICWTSSETSGYVQLAVLDAEGQGVFVDTVPVTDGCVSYTPCSYMDGDDFRVTGSFTTGNPMMGLMIGDDSNADFTITGIDPEPTLDVTYPDGGELLTAGGTYPITWTATNATEKTVYIQLYHSDGHVAYIGQAPAEDESFEWTVCPRMGDGTHYKIELMISESGCPTIRNESDAEFTITGSDPEPTLDVTYPDGGETLTAGDTYDITWNATNATAEMVRIDLYWDMGAYPQYVTNIGQAPAENESFSWTICPWIGDGTNYIVQIRLSQDDCPYIADSSENTFTITGSQLEPTLELISPSGGESWEAGQTYPITWSATNASGKTLNIDLHKTNGDHVAHIGEALAEDGSFNWTICPYIGDASDYMIQIGIYEETCAVTDNSPAFEITGSVDPPTLELIWPVGGELLDAGAPDPYPITWSVTNATGKYVDISLSRDMGSHQEHIMGLAHVPAEDETWDWDICPYIGDETNYVIVICIHEDEDGCPSVCDGSGSFAITGSVDPPTLELTSPSGGESWEAGDTYPITWSVTNASGKTVCFSLQTTTGENVSGLGCVPAEDGSWDWTICPWVGDGTDYVINACICEPDCEGFILECICDTSGAFEITGSDPEPTLELISPSGGESWEAGSTHPITWSVTNASGKNVNIDLFKTNGEEVAPIGVTPAEDGTFEWTICPYIGDASDYMIQIGIYEETCAVTDNSPAFEITGSDPEPTLLTLDSPTTSDSWPVGSQQTIEWSTDATAGTVCIELDKGGSLLQHLGCAPATDGQFTWWNVAPADLAEGTDYTILITYSQDGCPEINLSDESGQFEITTSSISGSVTKTGGIGLGGIIVELRGLSDGGGEFTASYAVTTSPDGDYTLIGVPPGSYRLRAGGDLDWGIEPAVEDPSSNHWYERVDQAALGYDTSQSFCASRGGYLTAISSQDENDWLWNNIPYIEGTMTGGTDRDVENTWTWANGEPFSYTNWQTGQPDNWNNEDYLMLNEPDGQWNDAQFFAGPFLCEYEALPATVSNYARIYYPDTPYSHEGDVIEVLASQQQTGMDFVLPLGGSITGHIYESDQVTPIVGAGIHVWPSQWGEDVGFHTQSDENGSYRIDHLYAGIFMMLVDPSGYIPMNFDNKFPWEEQDYFTIVPPDIVENADFAMTTGHQISGTVEINATGQENVHVSVHGSTKSVWAGDQTDSNGDYCISGLPNDDYTVMVSEYTDGGTTYGPEVYNNKLTWDDADPVTVADADVADIDFTLDAAGWITGNVSDEDTLEPLSGCLVCVDLWRDDQAYGTPFCVATNHQGDYILTLKEGTYLVRADRTGYVSEYYDSAFNPEFATPIPVVAGQAETGKDINLNRTYNISGTVVDSETLQLLPGVSVCSVPDPLVPGVGSCDITDGQGEFTIEGLPDGDYDVMASAPGYCPQTNQTTIAGADVTGLAVQINKTVLPDSDGDCDVDQDDFNVFQACASGPAIPLVPGCEDADLDGDNDVDVSDFAVFQRCFSGAGNPPDLSCAD